MMATYGKCHLAWQMRTSANPYCWLAVLSGKPAGFRCIKEEMRVAVATTHPWFCLHNPRLTTTLRSKGAIKI
jgi:hypothetical protein